MAKELVPTHFPDLTAGVRTEGAPYLLKPGEVLRAQNLREDSGVLVQTHGSAVDLWHKGLVFDGTDDYCNITNGAQTGIHTAGDICLRWVGSADIITAGTRTIIGQWGNSNSTRGYRLYQSGSSFVFEIQNGGDIEGVTSTITINVGVVYRVQVTYTEATNTSEISVAAAGTAWASATVTTQIHTLVTTRQSVTQDTRVGADNDAGAVGNFFDGTMYFLSFQSTIPAAALTFQYDSTPRNQGLWWMVLDAAGTGVLDFGRDGGLTTNILTTNGTMVASATGS